jgi:hypothetical protein
VLCAQPAFVSACGQSEWSVMANHGMAAGATAAATRGTSAHKLRLDNAEAACVAHGPSSGHQRSLGGGVFEDLDHFVIEQLGNV